MIDRKIADKEQCKEKKIRIYPAQMETQTFGRLRVHATTAGVVPVPGAVVTITDPDMPENPIAQLITDASGQTEGIDLPTPPIDYSLEPTIQQPYALYNISITSPEFDPVNIVNAEIFPVVTAIQEATLMHQTPQQAGRVYVIPPHTLFGDYPPKIAESEVKPAAETGEIVLDRVVIPEFVIVHDGPPTDASAENHYIRFRDYVKNVASSEIYATWPDATIRANVLAILSFTLNRIYTEWYPNQGYNFTITSSTAFDHKWIPGRNIYNNIGVIVDELFVNYLSRPNVKQPILTQYCDGEKVQCPNWMTQWGSKYLGDQGRSAIEILRHFYGASMYINTAPEVAGVPASWPGTNLTVGSTGNSVRMIQEQLNRIADTYTLIQKVALDGNYGPQTAEAVTTFQRIFNLPQTGVVDFTTWYRISGIYVAVTRIAEL